MGAFSDYLEAALLKTAFRNTPLAAPAALYVALHTADPTDVGNIGEVAVGGYARVSVSTGAAGTGVGSGWNAPVVSGGGNMVSNANSITFPVPSTTWGTITYFSLWDAATAGNCLFQGPLTIPKTINTGDTIQFNPGDLTISVD